MTLQEILRSKDKCGGCKHQDKHVYEHKCVGCIGGGRHRKIDNYELDESLKAIEEKAAKWGMIEWAIDKEVEFIEASYSTSKADLEHINKHDISRLEQLYKEREKDGKEV